VAVAGILIMAVFVRFYGLADQGIRTSDGGHYAHQARKVLLGDPNGIKDKPGHTLLIVIAFKLLGVKMGAPLYMSAVTGLLFILLVWLGVRHWYGVVPGLLTALMASLMPYLLSYHRSANSDSNVLFFIFAGLLVSGWGRDLLDRRDLKLARILLAFLSSGLLFGFALSTNYSMATTFLPVCLTLALGILMDRKQTRRYLTAGAVLGLGLLVGYFAIVAAMSPYTEKGEIERQVGYHAKTFLQFRLSLVPLGMLLRYVGIPPLLLAGAGLWRMWKRRRPFDLFGLVLAGFMALMYFRTSLPYPRVYVHLCLPLLLACAAGFEFVCTALTGRSLLRRAVLAGVLLATLGLQAREIASTVRLRSGYPEACEKLLAEGDAFRLGGTTHTWWTFAAFTGRPFHYCSEVLAKNLAAKDWETRVVQSFQRWHREGFTHIVLDYHLWNRMRWEHSERLGVFVERHPPAYRIPNPAAAHHQTMAEDGGLPEAGSEPLMASIYIYRLSDFGPEVD